MTTKSKPVPTAPKVKMIEGTTKAATETLVGKAIASIQARGKLLQRDIHVAAVSCLKHVELHGDVTLVNRLIDAVPDMTRKNVLRDWFCAFGKLTADEKAKTLVYNRDAVTMLAEATSTPFWSFKPEPAWVPFNFDKMIKAVIAKADKAKAKGEAADPRVEKLRALIDAE